MRLRHITLITLAIMILLTACQPMELAELNQTGNSAQANANTDNGINDTFVDSGVIIPPSFPFTGT